MIKEYRIFTECYLDNDLQKGHYDWNIMWKPRYKNCGYIIHCEEIDLLPLKLKYPDLDIKEIIQISVQVN